MHGSEAAWLCETCGAEYCTDCHRRCPYCRDASDHYDDDELGIDPEEEWDYE